MGNQLIEVSKIKVSDRVRSLDTGWVEALADDIAEKGQLQAVGVRETDDGITLVFGEHRLEAFKLLNRTHIEAKTLLINSNQAKIIEIDENILRMPFSPLSFAHALARRKEVYETAFPLSKNGAAGLIAMNTLQEDGQNANVCVQDKGQQNFSADTAERLGVSRRKIQAAIWLSYHFTRNAEKILIGHAIMDNSSQLHELAKLPTEEQEWVAEGLAKGEFNNVGTAVAAMSGHVAPNTERKSYAKTFTAYSRLASSWQAEFLTAASKGKLPPGFKIMVPEGIDG